MGEEGERVGEEAEIVGEEGEGVEEEVEELGEMNEMRETVDTTEREERPKDNPGKGSEVLVGSTPELGTEVGFPGFGDTISVSGVLVTVMVFVTIMILGLCPWLFEGGWTSSKMQVVMGITHRESSCARATAARKRVKKTA